MCCHFRWRFKCAPHQVYNGCSVLRWLARVCCLPHSDVWGFCIMLLLSSRVAKRVLVPQPSPCCVFSVAVISYLLLILQTQHVACKMHGETSMPLLKLLAVCRCSWRYFTALCLTSALMVLLLLMTITTVLAHVLNTCCVSTSCRHTMYVAIG